MNFAEDLVQNTIFLLLQGNAAQTLDYRIYTWRELYLAIESLFCFPGSFNGYSF